MEYRYRTWPHTHLAVNRGSAKSLSLSSAAAASDRGNSQKREKSKVLSSPTLNNRKLPIFKSFENGHPAQATQEQPTVQSPGEVHGHVKA